MNALVADQVRFGDKAFAAFSADEVFLLSVDAEVLTQFVFQHKTFAALRTRIRLHAGVKGHVLVEISLLCEAFPALSASEGFFPGMNPAVGNERGVLSEIFRTPNTRRFSPRCARADG